jgi:hypothetical protein
MELEAFAAMTQRLIAADGFEAFLPTACFPARRVVRVLEGVPAAAELEAVTLEWALDAAEGDEEVLLAFKVDATHFKIIRRAEGRSEQGVYAADAADEPRPLS